MRITNKKNGLKKVLVRLVLLILCYTFLEASYHLIEGTGEAEAATIGEVLSKEEAEHIAQEPANLTALLDQFPQLNSHVNGAHRVDVGTMSNGKGDTHHTLVISRHDRVFSITIDARGNEVIHTHLPTNRTAWVFHIYEGIPDTSRFSAIGVTTFDRLRSTLSREQSPTWRIMHSSDAIAAINSGLLALKPDERKELLDNMIKHPHAAAIVQTTVGRGGENIYALRIAHYDENGNITNQTVHGTSVLMTTDNLMHLDSGQLAGRGNVVERTGIKTEFRNRVSTLTSVNVHNGELSEVTRLAQLANRELGSPSVVTEMVRSVSQKMLNNATTSAAPIDIIGKALKFDGFGGAASLDRSPITVIVVGVVTKAITALESGALSPRAEIHTSLQALDISFRDALSKAAVYASENGLDFTRLTQLDNLARKEFQDSSLIGSKIRPALQNKLNAAQTADDVNNVLIRFQRFGTTTLDRSIVANTARTAIINAIESGARVTADSVKTPEGILRALGQEGNAVIRALQESARRKVEGLRLRRMNELHDMSAAEFWAYRDRIKAAGRWSGFAGMNLRPNAENVVNSVNQAIRNGGAGRRRGEDILKLLKANGMVRQ